MMKRCGTWGGPFAARVKLKGKGKRYLVNAGQSYGEWLEPADVHPMDWKDMASPHPEVSTAYTAYVLGLQEIRSMGKKTITGNITLTPSECSTLKDYAVNG